MAWYSVKIGGNRYEVSVERADRLVAGGWRRQEEPEGAGTAPWYRMKQYCKNHKRGSFFTGG